MTAVQEQIQQKLQAAFDVSVLDVVNESHGHNVGPGAETHFKVTLVSEAFGSQSRVKRHQAIYAVLADELKAGVHALALHLYTPEEWSKQSEQAPQSPKCMGGAKK